MLTLLLFVLFDLIYCEIYSTFTLNCSNTNELTETIIRNKGCLPSSKNLCTRMSFLSLNDRIEIVKRLKGKGEAFYYGNNRKRYQIICHIY